MGVAFGAGVDQQQPARLDLRLVRMAMENLPVLGEDGGERNAPAGTEGGALHLADYLLLDAPEADAFTGRRMHVESEFGGGVKQRDFLRILHQSHLDDGTHQGLAGQRASLLADAEKRIRRHSEQAAELHGVVVAADREEMDTASCGKRGTHGVVERGIRR